MVDHLSNLFDVITFAFAVGLAGIACGFGFMVGVIIACEKWGHCLPLNVTLGFERLTVGSDAAVTKKEAPNEH